MFTEIPAWFVGCLALITGILVLTYDNRHSLTIKALVAPFIFNAIIYFYYAFFETVSPERMFITRLGVISYCLTTIIVMLGARWNHGR